MTTTVQQKLMSRYERVLKDLDVLTRATRKGMAEHAKLDDKVAACRVQRVIEDARRMLRLQIYEFQDAVSSLPNQAEDQP